MLMRVELPRLQVLGIHSTCKIMPKQVHEITKFMSGTMTTPSIRDVPEDAANYSLNLDSVTHDGSLKGIPSDKYASNAGWKNAPEETGIYGTLVFDAGGEG